MSDFLGRVHWFACNRSPEVSIGKGSEPLVRRPIQPADQVRTFQLLDLDWLPCFQLLHGNAPNFDLVSFLSGQIKS